MRGVVTAAWRRSLMCLPLDEAAAGDGDRVGPALVHLALSRELDVEGWA